METSVVLVLVWSTVLSWSAIQLRAQTAASTIGKELSEYKRLEDGEEFRIPLADLLDRGKRMLTTNWTYQLGGGRPMSKGTGDPISDSNRPLSFPRNFNRISAMDSNSCAGCHNAPFGIAGGVGDFVTNVFVLGQRFDFATFDRADLSADVGALDESGNFVTLDKIANSRSTVSMFGSGYVEMLARQMTADMLAMRDGLRPGASVELRTANGVSFGVLARNQDGTWDTSGISGLSAPMLASADTAHPPALLIRPFHQAGAVVSLRVFTNNAFNHHHGMQSTERFGKDTDPDGDGVTNELTRADITAAVVYQASLAVPGRVIPNDFAVEQAVLTGEQLFTKIKCASCHVPGLDLYGAPIFTEPNPYNPAGNLRPGDAPTFSVSLSDSLLPAPRLPVETSVRQFVQVPVFSDLKLHDITSGPNDPNREALDMQVTPAGAAGFFSGNSKFMTGRLWGVGNKINHFHHGKFVTIRESILAHSGEALESRQTFEALADSGKDSVIEFLKSLQVLPPGTRNLIVDENYKAKVWPPAQ